MTDPDVIVLVGGPRDGDLVAVPELPHTFRMTGLGMSAAEMMRVLAPSDPLPVVELRFRPRVVTGPDGGRVYVRNREGAVCYDMQRGGVDG